MSSKKELLEAIRKYYEAVGKGAYVDEILANLETTQDIVRTFRADAEAGSISVPPEVLEEYGPKRGFFLEEGIIEGVKSVAKALGLMDFTIDEATDYIRGVSGKGEVVEVSSKISLEEWDKRNEYEDIAKEDRTFADTSLTPEFKDRWETKYREEQKIEEQRKRAEEQRIADEIARDASNLINTTFNVGQGLDAVPTSLTEAVNLLRKYEQGKSLGFDEKKLLEGKVSNAFSNGDLSRGEFNAINNFLGNLPDVETDDDGKKKKKKKVVVETTEISNDWNTDGSNIINLNDKRYALFGLGDSYFRSAGSEEEFNILLEEGWKPIGNENPIWKNFAKSEGLLDDVEIIISDGSSYDGTDTDTDTGSNAANSESQIGSDAQIEFNNVPEGAELWDIEGKLYLAYEVPGADGELYIGSSMYMIYDIVDNDLKKAGLLTADAPNVKPNIIGNKSFLDSKAVLAGNTDQLSADIDHPFASFTDTLRTQIQVAPWLADNEAIALLAESAVEGRTVTDAEWQTTTWWKEHTEAEREWLRTYNSDPATATQLITDTQLSVQNSLQAAGVSNAPDALVDWVSNKFVSGQWSEAYTSEQIGLFADPYAQGTRDTEFENYLSSTAISGVDRTTQREREVEELFNTWLGPTLGNLTDSEKAEIAGRMRDDPDYKDTLVDSLKQSRLAAFSNYTNPELTYQDIARPWRNLTTSVWGQTADETQGWWQEMVKSNDFTTAQTTLREKGLENNIAQVTQDATGALTQALGEGLATQGVNQ